MTIRWKSLGMCGLAATLMLLGATLNVSGSGASTSGLVLLAIRNAELSGWVHETVDATGRGHRLSMNNDIGASEGRQIIISDGAHAQVLLIKGNAYLYGDSKAIANYFGISSTDPQRYANRWLELTPSNPGYATVSDAVTLKSDFRSVVMNGKVTEGPVVTIDGQNVRPLHSHFAGTSNAPAGNATLYVTTSGKILPFEYQVTANGTRSTTRWTSWGRGVNLAIPKSRLLGAEKPALDDRLAVLEHCRANILTISKSPLIATRHSSLIHSADRFVFVGRT